MALAPNPIPPLPNHFKIKVKKPDLITHESTLKVQVLSINDFYMMTHIEAELRVLEFNSEQYICAIADNNRSAFCIGRGHHDEYLNQDVITLLSVYPKD